MLQTMNTVSGIYERTFQLKLEVKQINDVGRVNYGEGSAQSLASFVEDVRRGSFGFNSRDFCVVHMFVSQSNWGSTAGIAMVGTVCRDSNVGITTDRIGNRLQNGQSLAITVAHEIGHNFGATHSFDRNSIMAATVSDGATQFSSGSIEQISNNLGAGCLMASGGGGSSSQPPPQNNLPESGHVPNPPQNPERQFPIVPSLPGGRPNSPISTFTNRPQTPDRPVSNNQDIPNGQTCLRRPGSPSSQRQPQRQPSPDIPKKEPPKNNTGSPVRRPNNPNFPQTPNRTVNNPNVPTRRSNNTGQIIPSPNPAIPNRPIQNPPKASVPNPNFPNRPPTAGRAGPGSPANPVQRPVPGPNNDVPNGQSNPNPNRGLPAGLNRPQIPRPNPNISNVPGRARPLTNAISTPLQALASNSYNPHNVPRYQPSNENNLAKTFDQGISGRGRGNVQVDEAINSLRIEGDMAYF
ncbi:hypothetical protein BKA69DRAFT_1066804 [Paraphysoderma sedebokerense]|nr:hypothetical protein BKA69DRAFT_1066804 [Paraphysoderma sedebokerense]